MQRLNSGRGPYIRSKTHPARLFTTLIQFQVNYKGYTGMSFNKSVKTMIWSGLTWSTRHFHALYFWLLGFCHLPRLDVKELLRPKARICYMNGKNTAVQWYIRFFCSNPCAHLKYSCFVQLLSCSSNETIMSDTKPVALCTNVTRE